MRPITLMSLLSAACSSAAGPASGGFQPPDDEEAGDEEAGSREPDAGPDAPAPPAALGRVALTEVYMNTMGMWMVGGEADFYRPADFAVPTPADLFGSCAVYQGEAAGENTGATLDAGSVTVGGANQPVEFSRGPGGYAAKGAGNTANLFDDGDLLHVEAAGGEDVPAFTGDVAAPPRILVSEPDLPAGLDLARSVPFRVAWTPGKAEAADMFLELTGGSAAIACGAADAAGEILVPPEALEHLPPGNDGMLMLTRTTRTTVRAGDALVSLEAATTECSMGSVR